MYCDAGLEDCAHWGVPHRRLFHGAGQEELPAAQSPGDGVDLPVQAGEQPLSHSDLLISAESESCSKLCYWGMPSQKLHSLSDVVWLASLVLGVAPDVRSRAAKVCMFSHMLPSSALLDPKGLEVVRSL